MLGDLCDGLDRMSVPLYGDQAGGGGEVPVPDVVPDPLKVPDPASCSRIEREDAVGKQVVAVPVDTVEVERSRSGRREDHSEPCVDRHAGPGVGAANEFVSIGRPRIVGEFARLRDRMEGPSQLARVHVERANVPGVPGSVSGTLLPMMMRSSKIAPGLLALTLARSAGMPSPSRRSMRRPHRGSDGLAGALVERVQKIAIAHKDAIVVDRYAAVAESRAGC